MVQFYPVHLPRQLEQEIKSLADSLLLPLKSTQQFSEIWHYTTAEGLIGILTNGCLRFTQIACLNDTQEKVYLGKVVHEVVKQRLSSISDADQELLLSFFDKGFVEDDYANDAHFVSCFSAIGDDLGQWRGYGGGENGFAIQFDRKILEERFIGNNPTRLAGFLNYKQEDHKDFAEKMIDGALNIFTNEIKSVSIDPRGFAEVFVNIFSRYFQRHASIVKHFAFEQEKEFRLVASRLSRPELNKVEFLQKKTLLAGYLSIDLRDPKTNLLPIKKILIGPGLNQRVSSVSAAHLRMQKGYPDNVSVELSDIPYRVP